MDVSVGQQLWLNEHPAAVLSVHDFGDCAVVTCLWLGGVGALPTVGGQPRPGSLRTKVVTLLHFPGGEWMRDFDCPMRVRVNDDPTRQVALAKWMQAFCQTIRPAPALHT